MWIKQLPEDSLWPPSLAINRIHHHPDPPMSDLSHHLTMLPILLPTTDIAIPQETHQMQANE